MQNDTSATTRIATVVRVPFDRRRQLFVPTEIVTSPESRLAYRIERLLGLIVYRYHARNSRYLGARKSTLQAVWTATLVNLHPIGAALQAQTA